MKKFAALTLAAALALPASAAGVTIGGYIDVGYAAIEGGALLNNTQTRGQASGSTNGTVNSNNDGFNLNEVNIDLNAQLTNDISAFMSLDFTGGTGATGQTGTGDVSVDYGYIDFANPGPFDLNLRVGRIPSVFGIEQRASESPQTKFINLSLVSPFTVGATDGLAIYGTFSPINYAFAVSNADVRGLNPLVVDATNTSVTVPTGIFPIAPGNNNGTANVASGNNNNDLAVSGRLGIVPIEGLEIGGSASYSTWNTAPNLGGQDDRDRTVYGLDASYSWGAFTLKGEYVKAGEEIVDPSNASPREADFRGFYIEGMYDVSSKYSVGVRYSDAEISGGNTTAGAVLLEADYSTLNIAGVYRVADNVQLKAEYDINRTDVRQSTNASIPGIALENDVFAVSLVGSF